jgi:hypothetical protein
MLHVACAHLAAPPFSWQALLHPWLTATPAGSCTATSIALPTSQPRSAQRARHWHVILRRSRRPFSSDANRRVPVRETWCDHQRTARRQLACPRKSPHGRRATSLSCRRVGSLCCRSFRALVSVPMSTGPDLVPWVLRGFICCNCLDPCQRSFSWLLLCGA